MTLNHDENLIFHKGTWVPPRLTLKTALTHCAAWLLRILTTLKVICLPFSLLNQMKTWGENLGCLQQQGDEPTAHSYINILDQASLPCLINIQPLELKGSCKLVNCSHHGTYHCHVNCEHYSCTILKDKHVKPKANNIKCRILLGA